MIRGWRLAATLIAMMFAEAIHPGVVAQLNGFAIVLAVAVIAVQDGSELGWNRVGTRPPANVTRN